MMKLTNDDMKQLAKTFANNIKIFNEFQNHYSPILANYGWYISGGMRVTSILEIHFHIKEKKINEAEKILINYYKNDIKRINGKLVKKYLDRKEILDEAFQAHKKGMYFCSTMLFLSQADGICEGKLFKGKKHLKAYLKPQKSPDIINTVLEKISSIDVDTRQLDRSNYFSTLNRHGVMHGLHYNFGQEKNSLKALSLLCFIADFIDRYNKLPSSK